MEFLVSCFLRYGTGFYVEFVNATIALSLALTLNDYDIKANWKRLLFASLLVGAESELFFHFPQWLRVGCLVGIYYLAFRVFFRFSIQRTFLGCLVVAFVLIIGHLNLSLIAAYMFNISMPELAASPRILLAFPFVYDIPLAILVYLSYTRQWRLLPNQHTDKAIKLAMPLFVQVIIMAVAICEILFLPLNETTRISGGTISFTLLFSTLLSFLFIWQVLQTAEREAQELAHERLATEIKSKINVIRIQRHDFINHIQTMIALLQSGQKDLLTRYVDILRKELESQD